MCPEGLRNSGMIIKSYIFFNNRSNSIDRTINATNHLKCHHTIFGAEIYTYVYPMDTHHGRKYEYKKINEINRNHRMYAYSRIISQHKWIYIYWHAILNYETISQSPLRVFEWTICACCTYIFRNTTRIESHFQGNWMFIFIGCIGADHIVSTKCGNLNYSNC